MDPKNEVHALSKIIKAVERGKELHPGPYTRQEWKKALLSEINEFISEPCQKCDFEGGCIGCNGMDRGQLAKFRSEIMDIAVVAYRFGQMLDEIITEKEKQLSREAMEHDPR